MNEHQDKKRCMIYPEQSIKMYWDLFIGAVLIFSCITTPYRIALVDVDSVGWVITNLIVDILFAIAILIIFNTAYYDDDFILIN